MHVTLDKTVQHRSAPNDLQACDITLKCTAQVSPTDLLVGDIRHDWAVPIDLHVCDASLMPSTSCGLLESNPWMSNLATKVPTLKG